MTKVSCGTMDWDDISDWLAWWLAEPKLLPAQQAIFDKNYRSYKNKKEFTCYLRRHYTRQTDAALPFRC